MSVQDGFKRTTISLRLEEYEALRFMAFKRKTSVAGVVRELIYERLEEEEDIRDGMKALEEKGDTMDWETFKNEYLDL
jgi:predicted DNA-binding protein